MSTERTLAASACLIPAGNQSLLQVTPGVDVDFALSEADCLSGAVEVLLSDAVSNGKGMGVDIAYLCRFALDVAHALRTASGATA